MAKITRLPYAGPREMEKYAHRDARGNAATGLDSFLFHQEPIGGPRLEKPTRPRVIRQLVGKHTSLKLRRRNKR